MRIDVVSIFPEYLEPLRLSLVGKAVDSGLVELGVHDLRQWTHDRHRTVDDTPYGGGAGMVMRPEPWGEALDALATPQTRLVLLTPAGRTFTQTTAYELAAEPHLVLACGRYEGIDARVAEDAATRMRVDEISIGDYVLNGGEAGVTTRPSRPSGSRSGRWCRVRVSACSQRQAAILAWCPLSSTSGTARPRHSSGLV